MKSYNKLNGFHTYILYLENVENTKRTYLNKQDHDMSETKSWKCWVNGLVRRKLIREATMKCHMMLPPPCFIVRMDLYQGQEILFILVSSDQRTFLYMFAGSLICLSANSKQDFIKLGECLGCPWLSWLSW